MGRKRLGLVTDGAFEAGLNVRLDPQCSTEDLRIGSFVVVEGESHRFFCTISDMQLRATDNRLLADPPKDASPLVSEALRGTATYAVVQVKPHLMLDISKGAGEESPPEPVRTIPMHFAALYEASALDLATVFGQEGGMNFAMGSPLTMDLPICLRLDRFVERSNGLFGQTGTGKSFLARLLLAGIIKAKAAMLLVFDMHNEYAFGSQTEDGGWVRGLRDLFGPQALVYSLDEKWGAEHNADVTLKVGLNQIELGDVLLLAEELELSPTAVTTAELVYARFHEEWMRRLLALDSSDPEALSDFCVFTGAQSESVKALHRRMRRIAGREYVEDTVTFSTIDQMVEALDRGLHIILDYMLVANIVTRRIRRLYQEKVARYERSRREEDKPRPLLITVEEAHKFLSPLVSKQTIFGTIARELRKFYVTLMVIDQRPSGIDPEVMSQLGTRITGKLTDQRDIEAVFTGVGGRSFLRNALESLGTRQEVLMMGHAVPMPMVVRTRRYDEAFYGAMGYRGPEEKRGEALRDIEELFGEEGSRP
jgi:DNA helicase HerA-like ATPase